MTDPDPHTAAVFGRYDRVRAILAADPAAIHSRGRFGMTALHGVARVDHPEMSRPHADAGAAPRCQPGRGGVE